MRKTPPAHRFVKTCGFRSLDSRSTFFFSTCIDLLGIFFTFFEFLKKNQSTNNTIRISSTVKKNELTLAEKKILKEKRLKPQQPEDPNKPICRIRFDSSDSEAES